MQLLEIAEDNPNSAVATFYHLKDVNEQVAMYFFDTPCRWQGVLQ